MKLTPTEEPVPPRGAGVSFLDRPVFICGHRRSGTTMLVSLLENHPDLLVYPTDSGFFYAVYPVLMTADHALAERVERVVGFCIKNLEDIIEESFSEAEKGEIAFPFDAFRDDFRQLAAETGGTSRELLMSLAQAYHQQYRRPQHPLRWVEKTTSSEIYAADALRWFPEARFIHVVRDPRDNWASLKSGWDARFKYHNDSLERLMHSMIERGRFGFELSTRNSALFGSSVYRVLRFEDLVTDTPTVMRSICEFIDLPFSDEVLQPTICGRPWKGNNYNRTGFTGPSRQNSGRWRERISDNEARLIEYHFEEFMTQYGYELCFPLRERVEAAVEHYRWYNYAQSYSFAATQSVQIRLEREE